MKWILYMIWLWLGIPMYAQTGFNRVYSVNNGPIIFLDLLLKGNTPYVSSIFFDTIPTPRTVSGLIQFDLDGNMLDTNYKRLSYNYGASHKSIEVLSNGNIITIGEYGINNHTAIVYEYAVDSVKQIWLLEDTLSNTFACVDAEITDDGSIYLLILQQFESNYDINTYVIKTDSNFNEIWRKKYGIVGYSEFPYCITELENGDLMLGSVKSNIGYISGTGDELFPTWFVRIDTSGTVVQQWQDPDNNSYMPGKIVESPDHGYVYCGGYIGYHGNTGIPYVKDYLCKVDSVFNKQWDIVFSNMSSNIPPQLEDIVIVGDIIYTVGMEVDTFTNNNYGVLYAVDLSGNQIFTRYYDLPSSLDSVSYPCCSFKYLYSIDTIGDSTLMMAGQIQADTYPGYPSQYGWLIKTDILGCFADTCQPQADTSYKPFPPQVNGMRIHPNPVTHELNVWTDPHLEGAVFTIINMSGQILQQGVIRADYTIFDVSNYSRGVYVIRLTKDEKTLNTRFVKQ